MSSDDIYNIEKPLIKDESWLIFPKSTVSNINTMDCKDTIAGECYYNKSLTECIEKCDKSTNCSFGYFISNTTDPKGKDICVPLRDSNINGNPIYRLRKQSIYPELEGTNSTVFINRNKYKFPPEQANDVFYMDNLLIKNIETNTLLGNSPVNKDLDKKIYASFEKNGGLIVQPLHIPTDFKSGAHYINLKYGDYLIFNIPSTALIIKPSESNNKIEWVSKYFDISEDLVCNIIPIKGKKIGDIVKYTDEFSIKISDSILGITNNTLELNIVKLQYNSYEKAKNNKENVTFKFIPKMKGWYCNNDSKCTEIPLDKMIINKDGVGTYDGLPIGRNPGCWGVCKYKIPNQSRLKSLDVYKDPVEGKINLLWFILPSIVIFFIIFFITFKK